MTCAEIRHPTKCSLRYLPVVDTVVRRMLFSDGPDQGVPGWLKVRGLRACRHAQRH